MFRKTVSNCVLAAAMLSSVIAAPAIAEEAEALTPAMVEQLALAEKLIAYGKARRDPILMIAAVKLRGDLSKEAAAEAAVTSSEDAMKLAGEFAAASEATRAVIAEIEGEASRGWSSSGYCYTFGSSSSCGH